MKMKRRGFFGMLAAAIAAPAAAKVVEPEPEVMLTRDNRLNFPRDSAIYISSDAGGCVDMDMTPWIEGMGWAPSKGSNFPIG